MNQLLDFMPIFLFAVVFFLSDIYYATAALMAGVTIQVATYRLIGKPISRELGITFWASLIFGGLTLFFRDALFIQWKPTIVNWLLAASLLGSHFVGKRNIIARLFGKQLTLPNAVWAKLNFGWAVGFLIAGALNLAVAYNFSMEFWVSYKLVGGFALTFFYIVVTMTYLNKKGLLAEQTDGFEVEK